MRQILVSLYWYTPDLRFGRRLVFRGIHFGRYSRRTKLKKPRNDNYSFRKK